MSTKVSAQMSIHTFSKFAQMSYVHTHVLFLFYANRIHISF
jgi:hypothetical protein